MSKREIKFKVRLKKEKRLRDAYGIDNLHKKALVSISGSLEWIDYEETFEFIGYFDCKGTEIYEGNILQANEQFERLNEYPIIVIDWDEKGAQFIGRTINGGQFTVPKCWIKSAKIIGHIAENPELLTNKDFLKLYDRLMGSKQKNKPQDKKAPAKSTSKNKR